MAPSTSAFTRWTALAALASLAAAQSDNSAADTDSDGSDGKHLFSGYIPELWAGVLFLAIYALLTVWHWVLWARNGKHRYMLTLTISMTTMTLGFILRLAYRASPYSLGLYAIQLLFLLLSPCAFLATDYVIFKRLAVSMGPDVVKSCLFLPIGIIVKLFVWVDVITFLLQAAGGGASAGDGKIQEIGPLIAFAGLVVQLASFALFTLLLLVFAFRVRSRFPHLGSPFPKFNPFKLNPWSTSLVNDWRAIWWVLVVTCVLILIRCVFRAIEWKQGYTGYLLTHEDRSTGAAQSHLEAGNGAYMGQQQSAEKDIPLR
ncbi:hypothetical protein JCM10207_003094 [Rhodosporidiobolus poonsookiae]